MTIATRVLMFALCCFVALASAQEVNITVRGKATPGTEDWRCDAFTEIVGALNAELEAEGDSRTVTVTPACDNTDWGEYKQEFVLSSDSGNAPEIYIAAHPDIGALATGGYIIPLDDMIVGEDGYLFDEFADVIDALWPSVTYQGQVWAIPQDAEARPLYYSKPLLAELGWSDADIDGLPDRIRSGEFTWSNLTATAQEAVDTGVVDEGNGFWHRPSNGPDFLYYYFGFGGELESEDGQTIVFDTDVAQQVYSLFADLTQSGIMRDDMLAGLEWSEWHDATSGAQDVLFWAGGTWNWGDWAANYRAADGGEEYLFENIGYALIPAMAEGRQPITLTHPLVYTISSEAEHPDLALRLIAKVTTAPINTLHAVNSAHLGIVKSQSDFPAYVEDAFLSDVLYMLEHTTFISNSEYFSAWSGAYFEGIQAVQSGDVTSDEATAFVAQRLQNELRGNVEIR